LGIQYKANVEPKMKTKAPPAKKGKKGRNLAKKLKKREWPQYLCHLIKRERENMQKKKNISMSNLSKQHYRYLQI